MVTDHFETRAIHAGQEPDPTTGAVIVPIYQTATYAQADVGVTKGYDYSRTANPTRAALEQCLASLEGGAYGLAFASGMDAITTLMLLLKSGDHVVACDDVYGGTYRLFRRVLDAYGLEFSFVDMTDRAATEGAMRPNTKMLWLETPTNPLLSRGHCRARGIGEVARRALGRGQHLRVAVLAAAACARRGHRDAKHDEIPGRAQRRGRRAQSLGPFDCWLTLRVARFLEAHPRVERVIYPGLESHPQHTLAREQMRALAPRSERGSGGMVSFIPKGGASAARALTRLMRVSTRWSSSASCITSRIGAARSPKLRGYSSRTACSISRKCSWDSSARR